MNVKDLDLESIVNILIKLNQASNEEKITEEQMQEWHEQDIKDGLY